MSTITESVDVEVDGFAENVADKLGIVQRRVKADMGRFKEFIEKRGGQTGAWRGEVGRSTP